MIQPIEQDGYSTKHIEGYFLIAAGFFIYILGALSWIPETENIVYRQMTVFDILQYSLGISILVALFIYSRLFLQVFRNWLKEHFKGELENIQARIQLFEAWVFFGLLIVTYILTVPDLKVILIKIGLYQHLLILPFNLLFIVLVVLKARRIWELTKVAIAEHAATQKESDSPPQ